MVIPSISFGDLLLLLLLGSWRLRWSGVVGDGVGDDVGDWVEDTEAHAGLEETRGQRGDTLLRQPMERQLVEPTDGIKEDAYVLLLALICNAIWTVIADAASALAMHIDGRTFSALGRLVVRSAARREGWGKVREGIAAAAVWWRSRPEGNLANREVKFNMPACEKVGPGEKSMYFSKIIFLKFKRF
jgi:hypothetical protein